MFSHFLINNFFLKLRKMRMIHPSVLGRYSLWLDEIYREVVIFFARLETLLAFETEHAEERS